MILPLMLTAAMVAAPPSPRAVHERQQTIERRHIRRLNRNSTDLGQSGVGYSVWYDGPVFYPPTAGQLPPGWIQAYGPFLFRMAEAMGGY
jgi:hypothetical protein